MDAQGPAYPIYKTEDDVTAWEVLLARAITEINPLYFETNPRFKGIRRIRSSNLVDYLGIYEEGDWWVLTIIEVILEDRKTEYVFLPLTARASGAKVALPDKLPAGIAQPAFGLQTRSEFHGVRSWKVVDAFSDPGFHQKMLALFLPWENVPETHVNAYVEMHEYGLGKFIFQANDDLQTWWNERNTTLQISIRFTEANEVVLHYGDVYRLNVYGVLPEFDREVLERSLEVVGWIDYRGNKQPEWLISVVIES